MENTDGEHKVDWFSVTSSLKLLTDSLICAICKEFLTTPVLITVCSHNFCSICIRRYFTIKQECPICGMEASSNNLTPNRLVETITRHFQNFRSLIDKNYRKNMINGQASANHHTDTQKQISCKSKICENDFKPNINKDRQATSTMFDPSSVEVNATPKFSLALNEFCTQSQDFLLDGNANDTSCLQTKKDHSALTPGGLRRTDTSSNTLTDHSSSQTANNEAKFLDDEAKCPVCGLKVSTSNINSHLDSCLAREEKKNSLRQNTPKRMKRNNPSTAKLAYNLLSLRDLRKKMKEIGLPTNGGKAELKRRHQEFVIKYQAEMDKASPRPVSIIMEELKREETMRKNTESKFKLFEKISPPKPTNEMDHNRQHVEKHAKQYRELEKLAEKSLSKRRKIMNKEKRRLFISRSFSSDTLQEKSSELRKESGMEFIKRKECEVESENSSEVVQDSEPFPSSSFDEVPLSSIPSCSGSGESPDLYAADDVNAGELESDAKSRASNLRSAIKADSQAEQIMDCIDASLSQSY